MSFSTTIHISHSWSCVKIIFFSSDEYDVPHDQSCMTRKSAWIHSSVRHINTKTQKPAAIPYLTKIRQNIIWTRPD